MCEPVSISTTTLAIMGGMAALSAGTSALSIYQGNQNAKEQVKAATEAATADFAALQDQRTELDKYAAGESLNIQRQLMQERATLRVAQGESGLVGNTPGRELANISLKGAEALGTIEANREAGVAQGARGIEQVSANFRSRSSEAMSRYTSGWAAGLQIGGSAISGAWQGYQIGDKISPSNKKKS